MNVHSKALLVASLTMTLAACGKSEPAPITPPINAPVVDTAPLPTPVGQTEKPSGSSEAQQYFVANVYTALTDIEGNDEACVNCHATGLLGAPTFLASSADNAYKVFRDYNGGALAAVPEANLLLLKSRHEGPDLNGAQRAAITEWLKLEYPSRPLPVGIKTVFDALFNFGNCMNRDEFISQGIDQLALTPLADNAAVNCTQCHSLAQAAINGGNFVLDADPNITFDKAKLFPGIMKYVEPIPGPTGAFDSLQESLRFERQGEEPNLVDVNGSCASANALDDQADDGIIDVFRADYCHPNYDIGDANEDKLQIFIGNTLNRANVQVCTAENNPGG
jgi:hypothetical protein